MSAALEITLIEDINTFVGSIPGNADLVVYERGTDPADGYTLYGFDEVGMFESELKDPAYCFVGFDFS